MSQPAAVSLDERLAAVKAERGDNVAVDEVADVVQALAPALDGAVGAGSGSADETRRLVDGLGRAERELNGLQPRTLCERHIEDACAELGAVVGHTEKAAEQVMDAGDRLAKMADELDGEARERLQGIAGELHEACAFQDITGQRVSKVLAVLRLIEHRLAGLADAIGDTVDEEQPSPVFDSEGNVIDAAALTHGPQHEGEGNSQDDIDAILASFD